MLQCVQANVGERVEPMMGLIYGRVACPIGVDESDSTLMHILSCTCVRNRFGLSFYLIRLWMLAYFCVPQPPTLGKIGWGILTTLTRCISHRILGLELVTAVGNGKKCMDLHR